MRSVFRLMVLFAAAALLAFGAAAQGEPTVAQIYQAANSGNLERANAMIEEVLKAHPNSARAHYVKAELAARGREFDVAKRELATAEKMAPGLPFAKAESVQALRNQLSNANAPATSTTQPRAKQMGAPADTGSLRPQEPAARGFPWGTLLLVGAVVAIGAMLLRRRQRAMEAASANGGYAPGAQPAYYPANGSGAQPYPPGYGPPQQQPSMGSSIGRGVATGLAIGAGAVAAQEIGRRMFEHGNANAAPLSGDNGPHPTLDQIDDGMRRNLNTDMGGDDFGIAGDGGWDDGGGGDAGGGGDW
ncbi:tetratricopeptide repeat protein [Ramlibacter sp. PS4R-6]|uniref:tetratricopeptide repeat protein n=1 Tax=Ramlibacter sp. PS4R-6 TaxID=3133438 RepID=UPI0030A620B6